jgi:hypothetical protein
MLGKGTLPFYHHLRSTDFVYRLIVIALYAKSGGKNGKHGSVDSSTTIGALSNIAVEASEYMFNNQFRTTTTATAAFYTKQFLLVRPLSFLVMLQYLPKPQRNNSILNIEAADLNLFTQLKNANASLATAMKLSRKHTKKHQVDMRPDDVSENDLDSAE